MHMPSSVFKKGDPIKGRTFSINDEIITVFNDLLQTLFPTYCLGCRRAHDEGAGDQAELDGGEERPPG